MKWIEGLIDLIGNAEAKRHKYNDRIDAMDKSQYKKLYDEVEFWHGTGRYHYMVSGKSKYHGEHSEKVVDVLGR